MSSRAILYLLFGCLLVITFAALIKYYYSKKRYKEVEEAKYRMLEDDDIDTDSIPPPDR